MLGAPFTFRVLDSDVVNAFAVPGGYVYVTRGLLAHLDNEAQLAVIPKEVPIMAVGGVKPDNMRPWLEAGATGFGLGGGLYHPGQSPAETLDKARAYVAGLKR